MFKRIPLVCLFLLSSLHGMDQPQSSNIPRAIKEVIFWYVNSMPLYQGLVESAEILDEYEVLSTSMVHPTSAVTTEVASCIQAELKACNLPACDIHMRKQKKPIMSGYKKLFIDEAYHQALSDALDNGLTTEQRAQLHYHLYRTSVYRNAYLKPKFIALAMSLPMLTRITCSYLNEYLPEEGIASWMLYIIQAYASSTITEHVMQRFLDHMQQEADDAVPNDPYILQAGIDYLKTHSDNERLGHRLKRITAYEHRLRELG